MLSGIHLLCNKNVTRDYSSKDSEDEMKKKEVIGHNQKTFMWPESKGLILGVLCYIFVSGLIRFHQQRP